MPMQPDFKRLETALFRGQPDRVPTAELKVEDYIKEAFLGEKIPSLADDPRGYIEKDIEFSVKAGYDFVRVAPTVCYGDHWVPATHRYAAGSDEQRQRKWAMTHEGIIRTVPSHRTLVAIGIDGKARHEAVVVDSPGSAFTAQCGKRSRSAREIPNEGLPINFFVVRRVIIAEPSDNLSPIVDPICFASISAGEWLDGRHIVLLGARRQNNDAGMNGIDDIKTSEAHHRIRDDQ